MRPLRAVAATCVAGAALWPVAANAGLEPDQDLTARHDVVVDGVTCPVDIAAQRFGDIAIVSTEVRSADAHCRVNSRITGHFTDAETGNERVASAAAISTTLTLRVEQVSRFRSSTHDLLFTWNNSQVVFELRAPK
jgi:hypothetical protein